MLCCTYWNCCSFVPELPQTAVPFLGRVPMIREKVSFVAMNPGPVVTETTKRHQSRSYSQQSENEPVAAMLPAKHLRSLGC